MTKSKPGAIPWERKPRAATPPKAPPPDAVPPKVFECETCLDEGVLYLSQFGKPDREINCTACDKSVPAKSGEIEWETYRKLRKSKPVRDFGRDSF